MTVSASPVPEPQVGPTLEDIQANEELALFIASADNVMEGLGYTEHGSRHALLSARIAYNVLSRTGHEEHEANLGAIAGYLHDVGNMATREMHPQVGAMLVYNALRGEMAGPDLATVVAAVANHEEPGGYAISPVAAAVILADKSDVHRSRVRKSPASAFDIHDRVNYAAEQSFLRVDSAAKTITLELAIDTEISQVMDYFQIFLERMTMCRKAAETLDSSFKLNINGADLL